MSDKIKHINPDGLMKNPAFSQVVTTHGSGKTIYIGGQNSVNADREIVGKGDIQAQTEQVMQNIQIALSDCNASFDNIVKLNIFIVQGQNAYGAFQTSQKYLSQASNPPVITVLFVAGLMNPDYLLEIDATAFVAD
jgi:enamine deaminase RidA (YjgF/YER057c/UK114 family)